jgi:hypothetical protein
MYHPPWSKSLDPQPTGTANNNNELTIGLNNSNPGSIVDLYDTPATPDPDNHEKGELGILGGAGKCSPFSESSGIQRVVCEVP